MAHIGSHISEQGEFDSVWLYGAFFQGANALVISASQRQLQFVAHGAYLTRFGKFAKYPKNCLNHDAWICVKDQAGDLRAENNLKFCPSNAAMVRVTGVGTDESPY
jgi:hypothetical protein